VALAAVAAPSLAAGDGMELVLSLGAGVYVPTRDNGGFVYDPVSGMTGLAVHALQPGVDLELAVSAWWGFFGAQVGVGAPALPDLERPPAGVEAAAHLGLERVHVVPRTRVGPGAGQDDVPGRALAP